MSSKTILAGGAIPARLARLGIDWIFVNSGTDFPPIIEGMAQAKAASVPLPSTVTVPHEHAAMGMAHGYWLISGRAQAVMLHTNVGLANGATGAINAACEHVPMFVMSGRTPVTESHRFGARTVPIAWGQEMADQAALIREAVKWEYELRFPEQVSVVIDRGLALSESTPKGPVYLSLPREVLCEDVSIDDVLAPPTATPARMGPDQHAIRQAAEMLAGARNPLVIAQRGAGDEGSFAVFADWVQLWGIAVSSWWATHLAIATDHPCHVGADPGEALAKADVVLVIDSLAPWWPDKHKMLDDAKVIQMGPDPLFRRFPMRGFPADLAIAGENRDTIPALIAAMDEIGEGNKARTGELAASNAKRQKAERIRIAASLADCLNKENVAHVLSEVLEGHKSSVFSELGVPLGPLARREPKSWFQEPHSGGLGWCFPAALGAQLAEPDRLCVATMGDGSYMFANPTACHLIAAAMKLPVLIMVLNNREWGAVRQSVVQMYPDGAAAKLNEIPLTSLKPTPDLCAIAGANGAFTINATNESQLRQALKQAIGVCINERRSAFVEVAVA